MKLTNLILIFNKTNSSYPETLEEMKCFGKNIYGVSNTVYEISKKVDKFFKTQNTCEKIEFNVIWFLRTCYKRPIDNFDPIDKCFSSKGFYNLEAAKKLYLGKIDKCIDEEMKYYFKRMGNDNHLPIKKELSINEEEIKKFKSKSEAKINTLWKVFNEEHDGFFQFVYQTNETNLSENRKFFIELIMSEGFSNVEFNFTVHEYFDQLRRLFDKNVEKGSPLCSEFEKKYAKNTEEMKKKDYCYEEMGELPIFYKKLKAYCTEKELDFDLLMTNIDNEDFSGFESIYARWVNSVNDLKEKSKVFDSDVHEFLKKGFKKLKIRIKNELRTYFYEFEVLKSECEALSNIKNNLNVRENFSGYYGVLLNTINTLEKYMSNYEDCGVYIKKLKKYSENLAKFALKR